MKKGGSVHQKMPHIHIGNYFVFEDLLQMCQHQAVFSMIH
uniref:Uncharacterized protein n=1 Tax=Anguilla anguilla TaxID=7936 RepID=A0A0E9TIM5_ANGAN